MRYEVKDDAGKIVSIHCDIKEFEDGKLKDYILIAKRQGALAVNIDIDMRPWNRTDKPEPYKKVWILMDDGVMHKDMLVKEKYGNLVWRDWDDKHVVGWREIGL